MIYHEKASVLEGSLTDQPKTHPAQRPGTAHEINHRVVRHKLGGMPQGPALLEKARNFKTAAQLRESGLYPYFRTISSAQDTEVVIEGKTVLMLGSNSYLGLRSEEHTSE